jgi:hypothetical protein
LLTLPALRVLDSGYRLVRQFNIKTPVDLDNLERFRMHAVDGDVQVDIVRIFVQAIDGLMVFPSEFFHEDAYRFFHLLRAGLLAFAPTHDVVIDRFLLRTDSAARATISSRCAAWPSQRKPRPLAYSTSHPGSGCGSRM